MKCNYLDEFCWWKIEFCAAPVGSHFSNITVVSNIPSSISNWYLAAYIPSERSCLHLHSSCLSSPFHKNCKWILKQQILVLGKLGYIKNIAWREAVKFRDNALAGLNLQLVGFFVKFFSQLDSCCLGRSGSRWYRSGRGSSPSPSGGGLQVAKNNICN